MFLQDESHPNVAWRIMLGIFAVGLVVIGSSAYWVYTWTLRDEGGIVAVTPKNNMVSTEEINAIVSEYKKKEDEHYTLRGKKIETVKESSVPTNGTPESGQQGAVPPSTQSVQ